MSVTEYGFFKLFAEYLSSVMNVAVATNIVVDASGHAIGIRFVAQSASPIISVDMLLRTYGDTSGCTFKFRIETDNNGVPSGTLLGSASAGFAGPSSATTQWWCGGGTNPINLGSNTGDLTVNNPYWLILYEDGTDPTGTNYIQAYRIASLNPSGTGASNRETFKLDDGSLAWNHATSGTNYVPIYILKTHDGNYHGLSITGPLNLPSAPDIYGTNRSGIKLRFGAKTYLHAIEINLRKTGSPSDLECKIYEGSTLKATITIASSAITTLTIRRYFLPTPQLLAADTDIYIIFGQDSSGGSDSADYHIYSMQCHPTYYASLVPTGYCCGVYGTGSDPTAFSAVSPEYVPHIYPLINDTINGLDMDAAGSGGGLLVHPGMNGGCNA